MLGRKADLLAGLVAGLVVAAMLAGCGSPAPTYDPFAAYTPEEKEKLIADKARRDARTAQRMAELRWEDTITDEVMSQAVAEGGTRVLEGIQSRGLDVFEGRWTATRSPFDDTLLYNYDKGTYRSESSTMGKGVYRGNFVYFPGNSPFWGTYVMIGSYTQPNGMEDKGIYVAENALADHPLLFQKATPDYLKKLEKQYETQIARYREEQMRLARARAAEEEEGDSWFSFGQVLSLGLGGLMVATADIPSADRLDIGTALFQDVMTGGESRALASITSQASGGYLPSRIAGAGPATDGGVTGFSAILTGDTSALDADMSRRRGAPSSAAASPGGAGAVRTAASAGRSMQYSFTCPDGNSSTVTIPYRTDACLTAKKEMTRIYSCNLIGDFPKVSSQCRSACGSSQCSE